MRTQLLLRGDSLSVRVRRKKKQAGNDFWFNWKRCWGCFFSLLWHSLRQTWESSAQPASSHEINCTATALSAVYLTAFYTLHTDSWNECTRSRWCHMLWIINIMDPCLYFLLFVKFRTSDFKLMILWLLFFFSFPKNTIVASLVNCSYSYQVTGMASLCKQQLVKLWGTFVQSLLLLLSSAQFLNSGAR